MGKVDKNVIVASAFIFVSSAVMSSIMIKQYDKIVQLKATLKVVNSESLVHKGAFEHAVNRMTPEQIIDLYKDLQAEEKFYGIVAEGYRKDI